MPIDDETRAKRVGPSMELKQVHNHPDDEDMVEPVFDDDEALEDIIAAAHHRFEDDAETSSLLSSSPPSSVVEQGMSQLSRSTRKRTSSRILGCVIIGVVAFATFVGITIGFSYYR